MPLKSTNPIFDTGSPLDDLRIGIPQTLQSKIKKKKNFIDAAKKRTFAVFYWKIHF